jgi:heme oxygenase
MSDDPARKLPRPPSKGRRWTSFVAPDDPSGRAVRRLEEESNPRHRVRVEHDGSTLLIHLSDEQGDGWTTFAVDRDTRRWAAGQAQRQVDAASEAYDNLYEVSDDT